jgi:hypothetical protein
MSILSNRDVSTSISVPVAISAFPGHKAQQFFNRRLDEGWLTDAASANRSGCPAIGLIVPPTCSDLLFRGLRSIE